MTEPYQDNPLFLALREKFKLADFRTGQKEIISDILQGRDTMAVMPTGGGKSLCFQLPALLKEGIAVVISPLIALMQDQAQALAKIGIPSGCLHSGQALEEKQRVFSQMKNERHFILYLSPERAQKEGFAQWVKRSPISLFAIDESHCISQWGPDFRKDYHRLSLLRELRPDVAILALTATATPQVLNDISRQLSLRQPARHIHGFYRPNLYYQVESCQNEIEKNALLRQALNQFPEGRVIVYCGTRRQTEEIASLLISEYSIGYYHAGLKTEERTQTQEDFSSGKIRILAATNAFGMGMDYPDVRLVVHFQMPANIESYYQEVGRGGRDGKDSSCLLMYSKKDKGLHTYFIKQSVTDAQITKRRWQSLDTIVQFMEGGECRHAGILTYFKDSFRLKACGHCDVCIPNSPRRVVPNEIPVAFSRKTQTRVRSSSKKILSQSPLNNEERVRSDILRKWRKSYADEHDIPAFIVFSDKTLYDLAQKAPKTLEELHKVYGMGPHKVEHLGKQILEQISIS